MLELKQGQRAVLVDKLPDFANVAAGAMVVGQFLSDRPFSPGVAAFGLISSEAPPQTAESRTPTSAVAPLRY